MGDKKFRSDLELTKEKIEQFFPDSNNRLSIEKILRDCIKLASQLNNSNWNVNFDGSFIRFNCGARYVLNINSSRIRVMCLRESFLNLGKEFITKFILTHTLYLEDSSKLLGVKIPRNYEEFIAIPTENLWHNSVQFEIPIDEWTNNYSKILTPSILDFAKDCINQSSIMTQMKTAHSPAIIELINEDLNEKLIQPSYQNTTSNFDNEGKFRSWMRKNSYTEKTIDTYCNALKSSVRKLTISKEIFIEENLFCYSNTQEYRQAKNIIMQVPNFNEIDEKAGNGAFKASLKKYEEFLEFYSMENTMETATQKYISLLKSNHNIILHGAPGTGKTYLAKEIAKNMGCTDNELGFVQFHPSYDYTDFVEGLRPVQNDDGSSIGFERKDGVFKEFCKRAAKNLADSKKSVETIKKEQTWQEKFDNFVNDEISNSTSMLHTITGTEFHIENRTSEKLIISIPQNEKTNKLSIDISEIMELLTNEVHLDSVREIKNHFNRKWPTQNDSYTFIIIKIVREIKTNVSSEPVNVVQKKPFVFIIDEINRGEMSKIFGELFFSIDPGYRGIKGRVQTQYQNLVDDGEFVKGFYVPENVYIIGTMNDIDRSVESMDFAMRRRFIFKEITAAESAVNMELSEDATRRMTNLNKAISSIEGLNSSYHIGGAYFLKENEVDGEQKKVSVESEDFEELWELKLEPLLKEYLRGMEDADEKLESLRTAYEKKDENDEENS